MADNVGAFRKQVPLADPRQKDPVTEFDHPEQGLGRRSVDINRLSDLRSYSYFFSLVLCRNSAIAETLAQQQNLASWQHPTSAKQAQFFDTPLGEYAPRALDGGNTSNDYCVLIFGATDAVFSITDVTWMSVTASEAVPGDQNTSIAVEGSFKVSEPRGILFVDKIVDCCTALGVDAATVSWMLKPFFVGYGTDTSTPQQDVATMIADVRPLMFIPYDVTGVYTEAGGTYEVQFVGLANGATRLPQYSRAADGVALSVGPSLRDSMQQLQNYINQRYKAYADCFLGKLNLLDDGFANKDGDYIPVEYIILLDPVYCNNRYLVSDRPQQYTDKPNCDKGKVYVKQTIGGSIESAIRGIMQLSPQVLEEMAGTKDGKGNVIKYEYKVQTALRSLNDRVQVVYTIKQFVSPKGGLIEQIIGGNSENERVFSDTVINNHLVLFDYMYTGLNTDILEFDLKLNLGLAYLQTATSANSFKSVLEASPSKSTHINPNAEINRLRPGYSLKTPLFFGAQAQRKGNNTLYPGENIGANYTMAKHASLEVAEATIRIRGNTAFLNTASELSSPESTFKFLDAFVRDKNGNTNVCSATPGPTGEQDTINRGMSMGDFPLLAKINIKMPANQDDLQAFQDKTNYATNFWFQGYYYIYGINHEFSNGEFTQTLNMIALPDPGTFDYLSNKRKSAVAFTKQTMDCYDGSIPCQQPKPSKDGAPDTRTGDDSLTAALQCTQNEQQRNSKTDCGTTTTPPPTPAPEPARVVPQTPPTPKPVRPSPPLNSTNQEDINLFAFRHAIAEGEGTLTSQGTINYKKIVNPGKEALVLTDHPALVPIPQLVKSTNFRTTSGARIVPKQLPGGKYTAFIDTTRGAADTTNAKIVLPSSAAGGYQLSRETWGNLKVSLGLPDFGPTSQDMAAEGLFKDRDAFNDVKAGKVTTALNKLGSAPTVWPSLPTATVLGQHQISMTEFLNIYESYGGINTEKQT